MKKTYPTKQGIIVEKGKILPWTLIFEVLSEALDPKIVATVKKQLSRNISFHESDLLTNCTQLAQLIGVKDGVNLHKRLMNKVNDINEKAEQEFGTLLLKEPINE